MAGFRHILTATILDAGASGLTPGDGRVYFVSPFAGKILRVFLTGTSPTAPHVVRFQSENNPAARALPIGPMPDTTATGEMVTFEVPTLLGINDISIGDAFWILTDGDGVGRLDVQCEFVPL